MTALPPLPDDVASLLRTAAAGPPPVPTGLEAEVLAKVLATTAVGAAGTAGVVASTGSGAASSSTTLFGVLAAKPLAAVAVALGVAAGGGGLALLAVRGDQPPPPVTAAAEAVATVPTPPPDIAAAEIATTPPSPAAPAAEAVIEEPPVAPMIEDAPARPPPLAVERGVPAVAPRAARSEAELIEDARGRLALGDGVGALSLLREHGRAWPRGGLREERRALTVVALAQSGEHERARSAARAFEREHPSSIFLPMVQAAAAAGEGAAP